METLDFNSLDKDQIKARDEFILKVKENAFLREEFDLRRWSMDNALKQEFRDSAISKGSYADYGLTQAQAQGVTEADLQEQESPNQSDEFSDLYVPLMLKYFRTLLVNMSNLCFPANGDWLDISRTFSKYFYQTGIEKFMPFVNDAWVDIIKTENQRFSLKEKYKVSMAEDISYGNTVLGHHYNPDLHYIEPYTPGIGQAGIWPITNDWRKSNICTYYDVNYMDLLSRSDFDQSVIEALEPSSSGEQARHLAGEGSTTINEHYEHQLPHGKVRCYDFFLPSVYLKSSERKTFIAKNVFITAVIKPRFKEDGKIDPSQSVHVLKATPNVSPVDHGLLFASFSTNLPGVFYNQGPLQPFLPHQYTANQIFSGISRLTAMISDPPKNVESTNGSMLDPFETPIPRFEPGAGYVGMRITPLIGAEFANSLNTFHSYMNFFERSVEEGIGVARNPGGGLANEGSTSAIQVKESYSGTQLNLVESAAQYDDQILRPSISIRIQATQDILKEQVEKAVKRALADKPEATNEDVAYEMALNENQLFNRLLNYCGIESSYEQFYKKTQAERIKDIQIAQEAMQMAQQIQQAVGFSQSPIPPMPPVPQSIDPKTGLPTPGPEQIMAMHQQYEQGEQQKRQQAAQDAKRMEIEMKIKELTFKDTKEPPVPSRKLFYQMLTASISDSDVVVTGSMTTVSKELSRQNLITFMQSLGVFPPEALQKIDFDSIVILLARANEIAPKDLLKDQSTLLREEEEAKQMAQNQQELINQAAQVPGAQPPQFS